MGCQIQQWMLYDVNTTLQHCHCLRQIDGQPWRIIAKIWLLSNRKLFIICQSSVSVFRVPTNI